MNILISRSTASGPGCLTYRITNNTQMPQGRIFLSPPPPWAWLVLLRGASHVGHRASSTVQSRAAIMRALGLSAAGRAGRGLASIVGQGCGLAPITLPEE